VQQSHVELVPARPVQETTKSEHAARVVGTDRGGIPVHDCLRRMPIASLRGRLVEVVGQVGADDRQQVAVDAQGVQHVGDLLRWGRADHERDAGPSVGQHALQERQLHLDRVLRSMGAVVDGDAFLPFGQNGARVDLHGHLTDRRGERRSSWHGDPGQGHVVSRTQHGDATHRRVAQPVVCRRCHRARIDVASVRDNQRNRCRPGSPLRCP
jgi:hypothetical protein